MISRKIALVLLVFSLCWVATAGFAGQAGAAHVQVSEDAVRALKSTSDAMVRIVEAVKPSVVNISSTKTVQVQQRQTPFDDPFFRRFFGDQFGRQFQEPRERAVTNLGSGVIVSMDGYILTNNHVVRDADEILVTLFDKREFQGKIVGTDPKTDIAVIKIEAQDLPVIRWGNSDKLRVGETVVAIGSPYGLSHTVTAGIVSAKGRANVRIADYEDFIQTDAAINPGNSGGPLISVMGELVGINTAIFSVTGGYQGIGFAIPSNMAAVVMKSLIEEGKVIRGWLGVTVQPVTEALARQFGLKDITGVLISDVVEGSPADKGGLRRGDVVVKYNGRDTREPIELRNLVAATKPGTRVAVVVIRDGKPRTLSVAIEELPSEKKELAGTYDNALRGVHVADITPEIRRALGLPDRLRGVVVTGVEIENGLARGDVIMEINRFKVASLADYRELASKIGPESDVLLLLYRGGSVIYLTIPAGTR